MGIEQIQKIHEFGEINVIISLLLCAMLVIALKAGWEKLLDVLGLETKASLQKKALEKKLSDMEQKIADLSSLNIIIMTSPLISEINSKIIRKYYKMALMN